MQIKPIETIYNGNKYRSRLEARWATFFDALNIRYEYEKEGYNLGKHGCYLPDFWINEWDAFVEIKPSNQYWFDDKCDALSNLSGKHVLRICGNPYLVETDAGARTEYIVSLYTSIEPLDTDGYIFARCRKCNGIDLLPLGEDNNICFMELSCERGCDTDKNPYPYDEKIMLAYTKARQARFEHGEHG